MEHTLQTALNILDHARIDLDDATDRADKNATARAKNAVKRAIRTVEAVQEREARARFLRN